MKLLVERMTFNLPHWSSSGSNTMKPGKTARGDRKPYRKVAVIGAAALVLLFSAGCGHHESESSGPETPPEVETVYPHVTTLTRRVEQPGHLLSYETTPIYTKIAGYAEDVNVDIGDKVEEGKVLTTLYVPEVKTDVRIKKARIEEAEADVVQAKENLEAAEANVKTWIAQVREAIAAVSRAEADYRRWASEYDRDKTLLEKGVFDKQTLDEALHQLKVSEAALEEMRAKKSAADASLSESRAKRNKAKADVRVSEAKLEVDKAQYQYAVDWYSYATLKAPYTGIVTKRNVHKGHFLQPVNSGSTSKAADPLFVVMRTDVMRVTVEVPETDASLIKVGDKAVVRLQALSGREVEGTVTRFSWSFDDRARTQRVEIHVPNPNGDLLRPGMYANITILAKRPHTTILPREAVLNDILANGDQSYCYVVEKDGKVKKTFLRLGVQGDEGLEVIQKSTDQKRWENVTGREAVVTTNPGSLLDGQVVQAKPAKAQWTEKGLRASR
jgi:HlyD family secretion protein